MCTPKQRKLCGECDICFNRSFASHEKSKYWSIKNSICPDKVFKGTLNKYWFDCGKCGHKFQSSPNMIVGKGSWCPYCANKILCEKECNICFKKSFASHEKSKYWSDKNSIFPDKVFKNSDNKFWFDCKECGHNFESSLHMIVSTWCPYCSTPPQKMCQNKCKTCFKKSFASHEKSKFWSAKNEIHPNKVFKNSGNKYWFDCNECDHDFESVIGSIVNNGRWCPYCANQKMCQNECKTCFKKSFASHEKSKYWSDKNSIFPDKVFKNSDNKFWFDCKECGHNFESSPGKIVGRSSWCPYCINKTEKKLYKWLLKRYDVTYQPKFDWCKNIKTNKYLPFDFLIEEYKTIIELDGGQHFKQVRNWMSPKDTQDRDVYKSNLAIENGYTVIRLLQEDVFHDKINWQECLVTRIFHRKIPKLKYISVTNCYDDFATVLKK